MDSCMLHLSALCILNSQSSSMQKITLKSKLMYNLCRLKLKQSPNLRSTFKSVDLAGKVCYEFVKGQKVWHCNVSYLLVATFGKLLGCPTLKFLVIHIARCQQQMCVNHAIFCWVCWKSTCWNKMKCFIPTFNNSLYVIVDYCCYAWYSCLLLEVQTLSRKSIYAQCHVWICICVLFVLYLYLPK